MFQRFRTHLPILATALIAGTVVAVGPTVAQAAYDAVNADKVDGKHAVGAGAPLAKAQGNLVAHDGQGRIPEKFIPGSILRGSSVVTSYGGGGWRPDSSAMPSSVDYHGTFVSFTGGGGGFLPLTSPMAIGSAGYQPESVEVCFATEGLAKLGSLSLAQSAPGSGTSTTRWTKAVDQATDGGTACVWHEVNSECDGAGTCVSTLQRGGSLLVATSGPGTVKLGGVRVRWIRG